MLAARRAAPPASRSESAAAHPGARRLSFVIQSKDVNPRPATILRPLSSTRSGDLQRPPRIGSNAGLVWWVNGEEVISLYHDRQA